MNYLAVTWADFSSITSALTSEFSTTALIGILAGVLGITVAFTLVWRFAAYIRRTVIGAMTNSKFKRGW